MKKFTNTQLKITNKHELLIDIPANAKQDKEKHWKKSQEKETGFKPLLKKKRSVYLFERQCYRKRKGKKFPFAGSFSKWPQCQSWGSVELGARSLFWVYHVDSVAQVLASSFAAFPGALEGAGLKVDQTGLEPVLWGMLIPQTQAFLARAHCQLH